MDGVEGVVGGCVNHLLCRLWMFRHRSWGGHWSVGVQLRRDALARMGGGPSHQVDLGVVWRGGGGVQPFVTNTSRSMLRESSFAGSHIGRSELWLILAPPDCLKLTQFTHLPRGEIVSMVLMLFERLL